MERAVANGGPVAIGFPAPTTALPLGNGPVLTTTLSFLSSRAQPRDLQCHGPFLEMLAYALGNLSSEVGNRMIDRDEERDQPGYL
jgi:hypothetical protein